MYESHFLLSRRPFGATPCADAYIPTGSLEQAKQTLIRCIDRAEGPGLIVGPAGTGKTLLCQVLAAHFRPRFQIAHLAGARLGTRRALLQNILFELKLPYRDMDEGELRLSLVDHLEPKAGGPAGLLLLVDEAHALPLRLLEETRLLTNLVRDGQTRVRLVLAGGMALEERLSSPKLASFHQRIAARCYLQPLGRDETIFYVQEQIRRCGASADNLFAAEAQAAIHTATDGIPRLINQVCDHVLLLAALGGQRQIDAGGIEEAWADLQQLPVPLHEPPVLSVPGQSAPSSILEFGQLSESPTIVAGTIGPQNADMAVAKLDSISRTLDSLQENGGAKAGSEAPVVEEFSPVGNTEVELIFHGSHDPFGGNWEEEEVVIDRYASLEDATLRRGRAASRSAREPGEAGAELASQGSDAIPGSLGSEEWIDANDSGSDEALALDALSDDSRQSTKPKRAAVPLRSVAQDDRDMILIDEEQSDKRPALANGPRRPEYQQLFSRLRGS